MGLFGDDTSFRSQSPQAAQGGTVPSGFTGYGYTGSPGQGYFYNDNGSQQNVTRRDLEGLAGQGLDQGTNNPINWEKPGTFSHNNLDLILNNRDSLTAGNTLPFAQQAFQRQFVNDPTTLVSDPSAYLYNNDPNFAKNQQQGLLEQAAAAQGRQAPGIDASATNMFMTGAGNSLAQSNLTNYLSLGNASNLSATANGAGYQGQLAAAQGLAGAAGGAAVQGQMGLAQQLQALGQRAPGPSVAEMQLRAGADASMQQQMAMAAGARGGNAGLALQNAGQGQGVAMGQLNQQAAQLRAQEDMANRQFSAGTLQGAAGLYGNAGALQGNLLGSSAQAYGNAAGIQQGALQGAGNLLGAVSANQNAQAGAGIAMANTYADLAKQQASNQLARQQQNDSYSMGLQGLGQQYLSDQLHSTAAYDQNRTGNAANVLTNQYANRDRSGEGTITGSGGGDKALGAGLQTGGTILASLSDIRAKTAIAPASGEVADAFRPLSSSSYFYRDPNAPGAAAGQQYGPMAQQLEQTPAGSTAVTQTPDGRKGIDTGRLSLLNASATADLRRELDALKGQATQIRAAKVEYPKLARLDSENANDEAALAGIDDAQRKALLAMKTPTTYPALGGYGPY